MSISVTDWARQQAASILILLFLSVGLASGSCAQLVPNASSLSAAADYLEATDADLNINGRILRFGPEAQIMLMAWGITEPAAITCTKSLVTPRLLANSGELKQTWAIILAKTLSAEDLEAAAAYQRSPAAQRLRASLQEMLRQLTDKTQPAKGSPTESANRAMPLKIIGPSPEDERAIYEFSISAAGQHVKATAEEVAAAWNAATIAWERRTVDRLLTQVGRSPC